MSPTKKQLQVQLKNCEVNKQLGLNQSLLELLGMEMSKCPAILHNLLENGIKTWDDLLVACDSRTVSIELVGGDEVNGTKLWYGRLDYINRCCVDAICQRNVDTNKLEPLPQLQEDEELWSNKDVLSFVKPPEFEAMLDDIQEGMENRGVSTIYYVGCVGLSGSGTTRCGIELVKAAVDSSPEPWKRGYLSAKYLPRCLEIEFEDHRKKMLLFSLALCYAFGIQPHEAIRYNVDWEEVQTRFLADFGGQEVQVVLLIDDFHMNPHAVRMLVDACNIMRRGWAYDMKVIPVLAGLPSTVDLLTKSFNVYLYTLNSIPHDKLSISFAQRIGITQDVLEKCPRLQNLVTACEGLPALLEMLASNLLHLEESRLCLLREKGIIDVADAKAISHVLMNFMEERYSLDGWDYALFDKVPDLEKKDRETILSDLLVDVLISAHVRFLDPISRNCDPQITYKFAETSGLIGFRPPNDDRFRDADNAQVMMPMLAVSVMNRYLKVIDEPIFNSNPFDSGFENHEQLAMVGLQAIVKFLIKNRDDGPNPQLFPDWMLRRDAFQERNAEFGIRPALVVPDSCNVVEVRQLFGGSKVDLRTVAKRNWAKSSMDTDHQGESVHKKLTHENIAERQAVMNNKNFADKMNPHPYRLRKRLKKSLKVNAKDESETTEKLNRSRNEKSRGECDFPEQVPGTILVSAVENKVIDGVSLFRGKLKTVQSCWILVFSRSEWSRPIDSQDEDVGISAQERIDETIDELCSKKDEIIRQWFGETVKDPVFVIFDIVTSISKRDLWKGVIEELPEDVFTCFITPFDSIEEVMKPVLAVRARMKWVQE